MTRVTLVEHVCLACLTSMFASVQFVSATYALAAVVAWGTSDFLGGYATRRANAFLFTTVVNLGGLLLVAMLATVSHVNSAVRPRLITTKMISVQTVERTERIFVHSALSRSPARGRLPTAGTAGEGGRGGGRGAGAAGDSVVIGHPRP